MRTILQKILLLVSLLIVLGSGIHAEENNISMEENNISINDKEFDFNKVAKQETDYANNQQLTLTDIENNLKFVYITAALYAFSLIIITLLIFIKRKDCHARDLVTIIGLVSVIFGTILLVLVAGDTQQVNAPIGILGAIAGYLFGASKKTEGSNEG